MLDAHKSVFARWIDHEPHRYIAHGDTVSNGVWMLWRGDLAEIIWESVLAAEGLTIASARPRWWRKGPWSPGHTAESIEKILHKATENLRGDYTECSFPIPDGETRVRFLTGHGMSTTLFAAAFEMGWRLFFRGNPEEHNALLIVDDGAAIGCVMPMRPNLPGERNDD